MTRLDTLNYVHATNNPIGYYIYTYSKDFASMTNVEFHNFIIFLKEHV